MVHAYPRLRPFDWHQTAKGMQLGIQPFGSRLHDAASNERESNLSELRLSIDLKLDIRYSVNIKFTNRKLGV